MRHIRNMRRIQVDAIKGNEVLAKNIFTDFDTILLSEGTVMRQSYISRLKELGIEDIYVEDEISEGIAVDEMTENRIKEQCQETVKKTVSQYICTGDNELKKIQDVAKTIILDILKEPQIVFNISGVRQKSELVYAHSLNVCALSVLLALKLNIPKKKVKEVAEGAILHDIGYYRVPVEMMGRDRNDYSEKEKRALRLHVVEGYSVVEYEGWLSKFSKDIILYHHERMDGSGYPLKLTGNKLNTGTKIVSICDYFDNLVYGNFMEKCKVHEAIHKIVQGAGKEFDAEIVKKFEQSVAAYPNGTLIITNKGEKGIVLRQNNQNPTKPVIRIFESKEGKRYSDWVEMNLAEQENITIMNTIEYY